MRISKRILLCAVGLMLIMPSAAIAGDFMCGDANHDGDLNVGDVVYIISFIFRGGPAPDPMHSADADGDCICNIADAVYLVNTIFKSGPLPVCPVCADATLLSGCQWFAGEKGAQAYTDCFEYEYDGAGNLRIIHTNALFNCCPDRIMFQATVADGVITVIEQEDTSINGGCDCICPFDIDYTVTEVPPGYYLIKVVGMYLFGEPPLQMYADLAAEPTGTVCLERPF